MLDRRSSISSQRPDRLEEAGFLPLCSVVIFVYLWLDYPFPRTNTRFVAVIIILR